MLSVASEEIAHQLESQLQVVSLANDDSQRGGR
jgi:hypothetical protein